MSVAPQAVRVESLKGVLDSLPTVETGARHAVARHLKGMWLDEAAVATPARWRVRNVLPDGAAVVVMGAANCGKSFWVLDLALHVAGGQPWRGNRTRRGLVVYIAAEGGHGFRNRLAAAKQQYPWAAGVPFYLITDTVNLMERDAEAIMAAVKSAEAEAGEPAALVVLDTLARVMAGGDENSGQDMGKLVAAVDAIRAQTGAAAILVHHEGKNAEKGARGHSSLRCAVDTEIRVEGVSGVRTATITKQRDGETGQVFAFELLPVELGRDDDGEVISSCVVESRDTPAVARSGPAAKAQVAILRLFESEAKAGRKVITTAELRRLAMERLYMKRTTAASAITGLTTAGWLVAQVGGLRLADEG